MKEIKRTRHEHPVLAENAIVWDSSTTERKRNSFGKARLESEEDGPDSGLLPNPSTPMSDATAETTTNRQSALSVPKRRLPSSSMVIHEHENAPHHLRTASSSSPRKHRQMHSDNRISPDRSKILDDQDTRNKVQADRYSPDVELTNNRWHQLAERARISKSTEGRGTFSIDSPLFTPSSDTSPMFADDLLDEGADTRGPLFPTESTMHQSIEVVEPSMSRNQSSPGKTSSRSSYRVRYSSISAVNAKKKDKLLPPIQIEDPSDVFTVKRARNTVAARKSRQKHSDNRISPDRLEILDDQDARNKVQVARYAPDIELTDEESTQLVERERISESRERRHYSRGRRRKTASATEFDSLFDEPVSAVPNIIEARFKTTSSRTEVAQKDMTAKAEAELEAQRRATEFQEALMMEGIKEETKESVDEYRIQAKAEAAAAKAKEDVDTETEQKAVPPREPPKLVNVHPPPPPPPKKPVKGAKFSFLGGSRPKPKIVKMKHVAIDGSQPGNRGEAEKQDDDTKTKKSKRETEEGSTKVQVITRNSDNENVTLESGQPQSQLLDINAVPESKLSHTISTADFETIHGIKGREAVLVDGPPQIIVVNPESRKSTSDNARNHSPARFLCATYTHRSIVRGSKPTSWLSDSDENTPLPPSPRTVKEKEAVTTNAPPTIERSLRSKDDSTNESATIPPPLDRGTEERKPWFPTDNDKTSQVVEELLRKWTFLE
ncbi:MAG: hypothetical protein Q9187_005092 [Circinaria calcarea]